MIIVMVTLIVVPYFTQILILRVIHPNLCISYPIIQHYTG
ncbi:unnamed protein product [Schistosoma mattheei]|uniref:Uncharacterized protein n=1 Tax=Schistosoma mattheei TaxID=31246 RepID=A0A183P364_9TREM|nr:unnamed protein product [Schistosoma mattheei]